MLTSDTKRHIDAARQVLVGVVPNPAAQIEQITNALIYKFMDDMDQSAVKAGDEPLFFIGDLERYAWSRLMDSRMGNQERMNLYSEALIKFSESKQLPQLFRDIFKSAFLPYRSPEVLGLFLKEIAYFDYSHSEELGNAYEYLLSIMSSQGDAGQFRTPRHIIDFIVEVVNPAKDDKILDPACGTAGFLISAYKHILEQHDGKSEDGSSNKENPLTPDQRRTLLGNFEGYDIDPSMVRIAQVNMYLHQFKNPKIYSYNTLADDERWGDKFDVILANPPFMSPKGGVNTHNKFSIESSRSEVLFVDYIMQHLRPKGRAGIIVPEGIIFQSNQGHIQLRKNLLADGLWAVVSLPSGIFNPYAGVKTSILLFDNDLAKKSKEIAFIKILNDGFDLGATKRPIIKNDLPEAIHILKEWKIGIKVEGSIAEYIEKSSIVETKDLNLSGDRYKKAINYSDKKWPFIELQDVCEITGGGTPSKANEEYWENGTVKWISAKHIQNSKIIGFDLITKEAVTESATSLIKPNSVLLVSRVSVGKLAFTDDYYAINQDITGLTSKNISKINNRYLFHVLHNIVNKIAEDAQGVGVRGVTRSYIGHIKIPLPPLEIQHQIVEELDSYQKIISGARQVVENWKPRIDVDPGWEKVKLGGICEINPKKSDIKNINLDSDVSFVPMSDLNQKSMFFEVKQKRKLSEVIKAYTFFAENDVLLARVTPCFENGKAGIAKNLVNKIGFGSSEYVVLRANKKILPEIVYAFIASNDFNISGRIKMTGTGGLQRVPLDFIKNWEINLPPLALQKKIVQQFQYEQILIDGTKKMAEIYEQKMKDVIVKLWK